MPYIMEMKYFTIHNVNMIFFPENIPSRKPYRFKRDSIIYFLHVFSFQNLQSWASALRPMHPASAFRIWLLSPVAEHSGTGLGTLIPVPDWLRDLYSYSFRYCSPDIPAFTKTLRRLKDLHNTGLYCFWWKDTLHTVHSPPSILLVA